MKKLNFILVLILFLISCSSEKEAESSFQPRVIGIVVSDMEASMNWYTSNLHFERDTVVSYGSSGISVGMMHQGEFYLELITFENSISKSELSLPEAYSNLYGFIKIGFQSNDIESLYMEMSYNELDIVAPLDNLPRLEGKEWPEKFFLVTDPDGNYVQFFSKTDGQQNFATDLKPFLIALSTPDIDQALDWYQKEIGASLFADKIGNPGNERALLEKDGFILEIGQFGADRDFEAIEKPADLGRSQVHGIAKLSFLMNGIIELNQQFKENSIKFDFELTETNSMVGDRYFMIQDLNGASLQFFELD